MPRPYHSPSSIELGRACRRAWYWQYVMGWCEETITWDQIEAGVAHQSRQRSTALGVAMHAQAEAHLLGQQVPYAWESLPGLMFAEGMHHLPSPDACGAREVEAPIGDVPIEGSDRIKSGRLIHGILWAGFIDYRVTAPSEAECARLGIPTVPVLTLDHKTCADLGKYAKTSAELMQDAAASVYAVDTCERYGLNESPQRWVYYASKNVRRSGAVDFTITHDQALETLAPYADLARDLDQIKTIEDAPCNTSACEDYGGRPCHISRGGPCDPPRRTLGSRLVALRKKETEKVKTSSFAEKFGKAKANVAASVETPADTVEAPAETVAEVTPTPAKVRHPRPAKAAPAKAPVAKAVALPEDSTAAKVAALSTRLVEAEGALLETKEAYQISRIACEQAGEQFSIAEAAHADILAELRGVLAWPAEDAAVEVEVEA
jgi:hypothetical protein